MYFKLFCDFCLPSSLQDLKDRSGPQAYSHLTVERENQRVRVLVVGGGVFYTLEPLGDNGRHLTLTVCPGLPLVSLSHACAHGHEHSHGEGSNYRGLISLLCSFLYFLSFLEYACTIFYQKMD